MACTYQAENKEKEIDKPVYEKGFISYYKRDTTSGKVADTAFIFKAITDSVITTEYRTSASSDTTYFGFTVPRYTDDYILSYEDTCQFVFRDTVTTKPDPMKILVYGQYSRDFTELHSLFFIDEDKNVFLIFDMHYLGSIFLHKNQLKNTDIQLIIDKTREAFSKTYSLPPKSTHKVQ